MVFLALRADLFDLLLQALDEQLPGFCIFRCAFYSAEPGKAQLVGHFHVPHIERQRRILLQYGAPYGLWVDSAPGRGTCISITLPAGSGREGGLPCCAQ